MKKVNDARSFTFFVAHWHNSRSDIVKRTTMDTKKDNRFDNKKEPRGNESRPTPPTATTADNASVYQQPSIEKATKDGKASRMDENSTEDRKHTP